MLNPDLFYSAFHMIISYLPVYTVTCTLVASLLTILLLPFLRVSSLYVFIHM